MKARDVIAGWPRGRSTSRPFPKPFVADVIAYKIEWGIYSRWRDCLEDLAEERRKADMMKYWYRFYFKGFRRLLSESNEQHSDDGGDCQPQPETNQESAVSFVSPSSHVESITSLTPNQLISEAVLEASFHHRGQVDKAGKPYILHPLRVMLAVASQPPASEQVTIEEEMAAAVLHDAVEDTELTLRDINVVFGETVGYLVAGLTKRGGEPYPEFIERIKANDPAVRKIKIADIRDNMGRLDQLENLIAKEMLRVKYLGALHRLGVE